MFFLIQLIKLAFIYLAEVVLGVGKDPVAPIEILDGDRHQRASGWLPLTEKTADRAAEERPPSPVTFTPFHATVAQATT